MALLKCPDCGHDMSDKAQACPNCGCPKNDIPEDLSNLIARHTINEDSETMTKRLLDKAEERLRNPGEIPYFYSGW